MHTSSAFFSAEPASRARAATLDTAMITGKNALFAALCLLLAAAYCCETIYVQRLNPFACEDAYITYRFARNLAEGHGPVFNPEERVEGYSNFLWMAGISLLYAAGLDPAACSRVLGVLFNTLTLLLVWYLPRRFCAVRGAWSLLGPLLYILFFPFQFFAFAGLETSLYSFFLVLLPATVVWARDRASRFCCAAALFVLLALTRPEGILFFIFYCVFLLWATRCRPAALRPYLPGLGAFVLAYGLFVAWRIGYFGLPLPNTYYAKCSFPFLLRTGLGIIINRDFFMNYAHLPLFLALSLVWSPAAGRTFVRTVIVLLSAALAFTVCFSGFDWMPFFRYTVPAVPLIIILCQVLFSSLWHELSAGTASGKKALAGCAAALFLFMAGEQFMRDLAYNTRWKAISDITYHNQITLGRWMKHTLGSGPLVAMGDVGRLAYFSNVRVLDVFGLNSRDFARLRTRYGAPHFDPSGGRLSFARYKQHERNLLLQRAPDYVFLYTATLKVADSFPGSAAGIAEHPTFREHYDYLARFYIIPPFTSEGWPRLPYSVDVLDLSAGLPAWIENGWGYDIHIRKDSTWPRFRLECDSQERITAIVNMRSCGGEQEGVP